MPIVPVVLPSGQRLLDTLDAGSHALSDEALELLAPYDITRDDVAEVMEHVVFALEKEYSESAADATQRVVRRICGGDAGAPRQSSGLLPRDLLADLRRFKPDELTKSADRASIVVAGGGDGIEAASAAVYLKLELQRSTQEPVALAVVESRRLPLEAVEALQPSSIIYVVLTEGVFRSAPLAAFHALAARRGALLQPVTTLQDFAFPSAAFLRQLAVEGVPLGATRGVAEEALDACMPEGWTWSGAAAAQERASGDEEPLSTEEVSGAWQCLFRQIAMPCNLNSSSEDAIREQVAALVARASSRLRRQLSDNRHTLDPAGHSSGLALRRKASTLWTRVPSSGSTTAASSGITTRYARGDARGASGATTASGGLSSGGGDRYRRPSCCGSGARYSRSVDEVEAVAEPPAELLGGTRRGWRSEPAARRAVGWRCSGAPVAEGREHIEPAQELDRLEEPSSSASDDDGSAGAREGSKV